jgi:hypothetical protein
MSQNAGSCLGGFYSCVVRGGPGFDYCDSAWGGDNDESCFTAEGAAKKLCGPRIQDPNVSETNASE